VIALGHFLLFFFCRTKGLNYIGFHLSSSRVSYLSLVHVVSSTW
jgi:hypothetical protein